MSRVDYDVVVAGGGIAGAALALALAQRDFEVGLVEPREPEGVSAGDPIGLRVSALSLGSRNLLQQLNVWSNLDGPRLTPYRAMHVWDEAAQLHFDAADIDSAALGFIVENALLQQALWAALRAHDRVALRTPASVKSFDGDDRSSRVILDNGDSIRCRLLVGADGAKSNIREKAGLKHLLVEYGQKAVVGVVETELNHASTAWQRFTDTGPVALLPLPDGHQVSIVWSTGTPEAEALLSLPDEPFGQALTDITTARLGQLKPVSRRAAFDLVRLEANRYIKPGLALIGDAAHVVHPLAGQGANMGLQDVAALVDVLGDARGRGAYLGSITCLRRYERWRRSENTVMSVTLDSLHKLFLSDKAPLPLLRQSGLNLVNRVGFARRLFAGHASGIGGRPASLLLPEQEMTL